MRGGTVSCKKMCFWRWSRRNIVLISVTLLFCYLLPQILFYKKQAELDDPYDAFPQYASYLSNAKKETPQLKRNDKNRFWVANQKSGEVIKKDRLVLPIVMKNKKKDLENGEFYIEQRPVIRISKNKKAGRLVIPKVLKEFGRLDQIGNKKKGGQSRVKQKSVIANKKTFRNLVNAAFKNKRKPFIPAAVDTNKKPLSPNILLKKKIEKVLKSKVQKKTDERNDQKKPTLGKTTSKNKAVKKNRLLKEKKPAPKKLAEKKLAPKKPTSNKLARKKPTLNKTAAKKPAPKKLARKKPAPNKPARKKPTLNKLARKKPTPNKVVRKKPTPNKLARKKPTPNKLARKKPTLNKTSAKKPAPNRPAPKKPALNKPAPNKRAQKETDSISKSVAKNSVTKKTSNKRQNTGASKKQQVKEQNKIGGTKLGKESIKETIERVKRNNGNYANNAIS